MFEVVSSKDNSASMWSVNARFFKKIMVLNSAQFETFLVTELLFKAYNKLTTSMT